MNKVGAFKAMLLSKRTTITGISSMVMGVLVGFGFIDLEQQTFFHCTKYLKSI